MYWWKIKRRMRQLVAYHPVLAVKLYQNHVDFDGHHRGLRPDTDVVVDAFPRSANTSFARKLIVAQEEDFNIAHHLHSPGIVVAAARRGIPAVTIIRRPRDAVISFAVFMFQRCPHVNCLLDVALREYLGYYRPLQALADKLAIVRFEDATSHFAATVEAINLRLGTKLKSGCQDPAFEEASQRYILASHQHFHGDSLGYADRNPMPSANRDQLKEKFRDAFNAPIYRRRRSEADQLYSWFSDLALKVGDHRPVICSPSDD